MYRRLILILVALAVVTPSTLMAQTYGSINTFSPYSMYGLGELQTQGTLSSRSMGGVGVAMRSGTEVNLLNPASSSSTFGKSILFSYGAEGSNYFNIQNQSGERVNNSYATFNIHDIALQIPLGKGAGVSVSLAPYSSVGYQISANSIEPDIGYITYLYEGGGDVTEVRVAAGWEIFDNFSVGLAAKYYWGTIYRSFRMVPYVVTGNGTYYEAVGETSYAISSIKAQLGLQWTPISTQTKVLTVGATYDLGGDLNPEYSHTVVGASSYFTIEATELIENMSLVLPSQLSVGVSYKNPKWLYALDYVYQDWYSQNKGLDNTIDTDSGVEISYNDFSTFKFGAQYTPNRNDVRKYYRRMSYRGGLRYGGYQQSFSGEEITQFAVTTGVSMPLKMNGVSKVDLGFEYGTRGSSSTSIETLTTSVGLIRQNYFKFSVGITLLGDDYWFQRPKFD